MNSKIFICMVFCFMLIIAGCSKDGFESRNALQAIDESAAQSANAASQISGSSVLASVDECDYVSMGASYSLKITGDLEGCWYTFIDAYECSPSGTYREQGRDYFVGTYKGSTGTFWTTYRFEAKYEGCAADGAPLGAEIFGRCQHPITAGTGTGVFEGATGRFDFKDNVVEMVYPYRGHIQY